MNQSAKLSSSVLITKQACQKELPNISSRYINLRDPCLYIILELKLRSKYNVLFKKNYLIKKYIAYIHIIISMSQMLAQQLIALPPKQMKKCFRIFLIYQQRKNSETIFLKRAQKANIWALSRQKVGLWLVNQFSQPIRGQFFGRKELKTFALCAHFKKCGL